MKRIIDNKDGYTLVELLAALTIIGIVFVALIPVFSQVIAWANKNETNLVANNVSDHFIHTYKNQEELYRFIANTQSIPTCNSTPLVYPEKDVAEIQKINYVSTIAICQSDEELGLNLYRIHLTVSPENDPKNSMETYFYLTSEAIANE